MGWEVEVVRHPWRPRGMWAVPGMEIAPEVLVFFERPRGFRHLPRRWVVKRTFAWMGCNQRMSKDYEYVPATSEAWMYLSMLRVMLKRLAREQIEPASHYRRVA